jgi:hypothetical protein
MLTATMVSGSDFSRAEPAVMTAQWITASIGAMVRARRRSAADRIEPPMSVKRPGSAANARWGGQRDTVQPDHVAPGGEQVLDDVERGEAGGTGDQDGHIRQDSIRLKIRGCCLTGPASTARRESSLHR